MSGSKKTKKNPSSLNTKKSVKKPTKKLAKKPTKKLVKKPTKKSPQNGLSSKKASPLKAKKLRFIMKNVRCFEGEQAFEIRPLTFLVGENSTGKTTVLSCFHALCDNRSPFQSFDFNNEPYQMGSFDTIARRNTSKKKEEPSFELGLICEEPELKYNARFLRDETAKPTVSCIKIFIKDIEADFKWDDKKCHCSIVSQKEKNNRLKYSLRKDSYSYFYNPFFILQEIIEEEKIRKEDRDMLEKFRLLWRDNRNMVFPRLLVNSAPVRSKPKRYYDSFKQRIYDPEGGDIPTAFMDLSIRNKKGWEKLVKKLIAFGRSAELFDNIEIARLGKASDSPFEIQLKVKGAKSNLIDIGYGVSQALPILGHLFFAPKASRFLLQQPEVHLHPKAQAALSSLFVEMAKSEEKSFLVETHSDYMINRAVIDIRKGNIPHDHVSLIYLENVKGGVKAHNIFFDETGNILNAPSGYRDFFIKETDRFLGFD